MEAMRIKTVADHGYADAAANPSKFPAGLFHICTGSYDFKEAFVEVDGVYTNKPPGGIAYRCSFRVTEAVYAVERMADIVAHELGIDPAEFRIRNFVKPDEPSPICRRWAGSTTAATTTARSKRRWRSSATPICAASKPRSRPRES